MIALTPQEQIIVDAAAVQGGRFRLDLLDPCVVAMGKPEDDPFDCTARHELTRRTLEKLESAGVVEGEADVFPPDVATFRFCDNQYQQKLYEGLSPERRRRLHYVIAISLEDASPVDGRSESVSAVDVANHYEQAGDPRRAAEFVLSAARAALKEDHPALAMALYERTLELMGEEISNGVLAVNLEVGELLLKKGQAESALERFRQVRMIAAILRNTTVGAAAMAKMGKCLASANDYEKALSLLQRARALCEENGDNLGLVRCLDDIGDVLLNWGCSGSAELARNQFERSLKLRKRIGHEQGMARTYHCLGKAMVKLGHREEARNCYLESIRMFRRQRDRSGTVGPLLSLAELQRRAGSVAHAVATLDDALAAACSSKNRTKQAMVLVTKAELCLEEKALDRARGLLDEAKQLSSRLDDRRLELLVLMVGSRLALGGGDIKTAERLCRQTLDLMQKHRIISEMSGTIRSMASDLLHAGRTQCNSGGKTAEWERRSGLARECLQAVISHCATVGNEAEAEACAPLLAETKSAQ